MKVLQVLNEIKPSGAEVMIQCASEYWQQHGVECEILATGKEIGPFADNLRAAGYKVHHLPVKFSIPSLRKYIRFIKQNGYDVIHQHLERDGYWIGLAAILAGKKLVRTVHNNFKFTGQLRLRRAVQRKHLESLGTKFVAISEGVNRTEKERYGTHPTVIYNWANLSLYAPANAAQREKARAEYGIAQDAFVILSVGNCSHVKNHASLIEAVAIVKEDWPNLIYLHLGIEDKDKSEQRLAQKLGIQHQVVFAGWSKDSTQALHAADAFIMPSLYEGFSIAALEALSTGIPALVADSPGLEELRNFYSDLIYTDTTPASIAEGLKTLKEQPAELKLKLKSLYPAVTQQHFSPKRGVAEYCALYQSLIEPLMQVGAKS